jgi:hypothetical protein
MPKLTDHKVLIFDVYGTLAVRFHRRALCKNSNEEGLILLKIGLGKGSI